MNKRYTYQTRRYNFAKKKKGSFIKKIFLSVFVFAIVSVTAKYNPTVNSALIYLLSNNVSYEDIPFSEHRTDFSDTESDQAITVFNPGDVMKNTDDTSISFRPPCMGEITSSFGKREPPLSNSSDFHNGIDIAGNEGDTVISISAGVVEKVGSDDKNGNYIVIKHNDKYTSGYAHLSKICIVEGESVDSNTKIGEMGSSGISTGVHLHLSLMEDNEYIDPCTFIKLPLRED